MKFVLPDLVGRRLTCTVFAPDTLLANVDARVPAGLSTHEITGIIGRSRPGGSFHTGTKLLLNSFPLPMVVVR
jgi:hypothetical protein